MRWGCWDRGERGREGGDDERGIGFGQREREGLGMMEAAR